MSTGRSIRLFLVDGTPNGLLTAEIMNWTGHVLTGPRSKLSELVQRSEAGRTGIYFLVGPDPDNSFKQLVYIGESDDVGTRLKQHNRPEEQGGKDFWEKVCIVTSKDQNLTKAHVKHLESKLISAAKEVNRCTLKNGTAHDYVSLPESDLADMEFFINQIRTILPVLGLDFLRELNRLSKAEGASKAESQKSPIFKLEIPKHGVVARAQEIDGEFFVLKGSMARDRWIGGSGGYQSLFQQLVDDGMLLPEGSLRRFVDDCTFSSPSAAAGVVAGRNSNGRINWVAEDTLQTYGDWQSEKVNAAAAGSEAIS
jgi:hypothetical protein